MLNMCTNPTANRLLIQGFMVFVTKIFTGTGNFRCLLFMYYLISFAMDC